MKYDTLIQRLYHEEVFSAMLPEYVSYKFKGKLKEEIEKRGLENERKPRISYVDLIVLSLYAEGLEPHAVKTYAYDSSIGIVYDVTIKRLEDLGLLENDKITKLGKEIVEYAYSIMDDVEEAIQKDSFANLLYKITNNKI